MVYQPQQWFDDNIAFPLSAERMTHIEDGLVEAAGSYTQSTVILTMAPNWSAFTGRELRVTRYPTGFAILSGQGVSPAIAVGETSQFTTLPSGFRPVVAMSTTASTSARVDGRIPTILTSFSLGGACTIQADADLPDRSMIYFTGIVWTVG